MKTKELQKILNKHQLWINSNGTKGECANFKDTDLSYAILSCRDLSYVNFIGANLSYATLNYTNLKFTNFSCANFNYASLRFADLEHADLSNTSFRDANLKNANLCNVNLTNANLIYTNFKDADLRGAKFFHTNFKCANLSNAIGLKNPIEWMKENFKKTAGGFIVYKVFGDTPFAKHIPNNWKIEENSYLEEECNFQRTDDCGCGVNFGTYNFCKSEYEDGELWECLIEFDDLLGVCVPYNTDGKARCMRLKLLKKIEVIQGDCCAI